MTVPPPGLRYRAFLSAYSSLLRAGLPLVWHYFRRRAARDPRYGEHLKERRGEGDAFAADLWVHAVSLGELRSAEPLIRLCLDAGWRIVTTHATPAGRSAAEDAFADAIAEGRLAVRYAPVDVRSYWRRFIHGTRPRVGLVMEMEFWPNMIETAAEEGVSLYLANSQVPGRSFPRARRLAAVAGHPVARTKGVFAKSERMAERFRALGAREVEALGETRFDVPPPNSHVSAGVKFAERVGRRVVTFASVVAGEEATCLAAVRSLLSDRAPALIVWVPRAPELFEATAERLRAAGLSVATRTDAFDRDLNQTSDLSQVDVLVGNSFGEMFFYLAAADVVVVGGGFVEKGAHNVIEPLALAKPVITGPHVWTIEFPGVEAQEAGVLTVTDKAGLADAIRLAMGNDGDAARRFHAKHGGASERIFSRIKPHVEDKRCVS